MFTLFIDGQYIFLNERQIKKSISQYNLAVWGEGGAQQFPHQGLIMSLSCKLAKSLLYFGTVVFH